MAKPVNKLKWATNDENDVITGAPNKTKPDTGTELSGLKREEPFFRSYINWILNNIGEWIDYFDTVISTITTNTTIYVSTSGDDVTGDGSVLTPYATPHKALESLVGTPISTDVIVTIFCEAGVYNLTTPLKINHPYGERIHIIGDTLIGNKPTGTQIADWSVDRTTPSVPDRGLDEFYNTAGTLGTNSTTTSRENAISADLINNKALVQERYTTIFNYIATTGIEVSGNNSLGKLDKIALMGDWDGDHTETVKTYHGIDSGASLDTFGFGTPNNVTGGTIFLGANTVILGFRGAGIRCRYIGCVSGEDNVAVVNNLWNGVDVNGTAVVVLNYSNILGNGNHGVFGTNTVSIKMGGSISSGNISNGIQVINCSSARIKEFKSLGNGDNGVATLVGSSSIMDGASCRGNGVSGIFTLINSSSDGDSVISSDNGSYGIYNQSSTYDGSSLTIENNGLDGLHAIDDGTMIVSSSTVQNNDGAEVYADRRSFIKITAATIPAASTVTAEKNSYISISNIAGVVYSPTYGTVGADGATINA